MGKRKGGGKEESCKNSAHWGLSLSENPSVEEVCQWLELVGLGMYRQAFRGSC